MTDEELLESYAERAAGCAQNACEARKKAKAEDDEDEAKRWTKIARGWSGQAAQLQRDITAMQARAGDKPQVNITGRGGTAKKSVPPRRF